MMKEVWKSALRHWRRFRSDFSHPYWDRFKLKDLTKRWDIDKLSKVDQWLQDFGKDAWVRPLEGTPAQSKSSFNWPLFSNPRYNRELTKFMFSFRDENSTNRNINNLMFITGPELSGKSWFLKQNLEKFEKSNLTKLLFSIDLIHHNALNFNTFLDIFENKIKSVLVNKSEEKFKEHYLVTPNMVFDLLLYKYDRLYLDIMLNRIVQKSVDTDDLLVLTLQQKEKLLEILAMNNNRTPGSTLIVDNFMEICSILSESSSELTKHKSLVRSALDLATAFCIQEELSSCPEANFTGFYRTGLCSTWFLLDLLNLIGGYHELNFPNLEYPHILVTIGRF